MRRFFFIALRRRVAEEVKVGDGVGLGGGAEVNDDRDAEDVRAKVRCSGSEVS